MNKPMMSAFAMTIGLAVIPDAGSSQLRDAVNVPSQLDHLIFGTPDLAVGNTRARELVML
jgi:hypothetical protein